MFNRLAAQIHQIRCGFDMFLWFMFPNYERKYGKPNAFMTEDFIINKMMIDSARQYIMKKPQDVKKVFYLFYDDGLTITEIAKELFMSESNVKNKLYRTLKELRELLNKD
jgi:DNA-directed RNA polymerase specialized sigma24 family protein